MLQIHSVTASWSGRCETQQPSCAHSGAASAIPDCSTSGGAGSVAPDVSGSGVAQVWRLAGHLTACSGATAAAAPRHQAQPCAAAKYTGAGVTAGASTRGRPESNATGVSRSVPQAPPTSTTAQDRHTCATQHMHQHKCRLDVRLYACTRHWRPPHHIRHACAAPGRSRTRKLTASPAWPRPPIKHWHQRPDSLRCNAPSAARNLHTMAEPHLPHLHVLHIRQQRYPPNTHAPPHTVATKSTSVRRGASLASTPCACSSRKLRPRL